MRTLFELMVITAESLGKKYTLRHQGSKEKYSTLRDAIVWAGQTFLQNAMAAVRGHWTPRSDESIEEFWALRDVSFEIKQGEVVGIIGGNGAGKSTLLKLLSRITEPSVGRITMRGRVASLLEVGTGFHPELSGRENIFLNGSILGMTRAEVKSRFDSIVEFAGVERFLDTPVKRYSSGMYVRLAFAVSAYFETEILLVDEVLAVGDLEFQKRCLGRMNEASQAGRTVLFVSHNLPIVGSLCGRCILLEQGRISKVGRTAEVLSSYQNEGRGASVRFEAEDRRPGRDKARLLGASIRDRAGKAKGEFTLFEEIRIWIEFEVLQELGEFVYPLIHMLDSKGEHVFLNGPSDWKPELTKGKGLYTACCVIPPHFLNEGVYSITVQINTVDVGHVLEVFERNLLSFTVIDPILDNAYRVHTKYSYFIPGSVRPLLPWTLERHRA